MVPLVGQILPYNQDKKYSSRPLCVVYYGVDFGFEYRVGTYFFSFTYLTISGFVSLEHSKLLHSFSVLVSCQS